MGLFFVCLFLFLFYERIRERIDLWSSEECNKGGEAGTIAQGGTAADKRREKERGWTGIHKGGGTLNIHM